MFRRALHDSRKINEPPEKWRVNYAVYILVRHPANLNWSAVEFERRIRATFELGGGHF